MLGQGRRLWPNIKSALDITGTRLLERLGYTYSKHTFIHVENTTGVQCLTKHGVPKCRRQEEKQIYTQQFCPAINPLKPLAISEKILLFVNRK